VDFSNHFKEFVNCKAVTLKMYLPKLWGFKQRKNLDADSSVSEKVT